MGDITKIAEEIGEVLKPGVDHYLTADDLANTSINIAQHFHDKLNSEEQQRKPGKLWASDIGKKCDRQLYYDMTLPPGSGEPLTVSNKVKFLYGNIIEDMIIGLIKATGKYEVTGEQARWEWQIPSTTGWTVSGRQDLMIDKHVVDVKSTSTYGFADYSQNGINQHNDKWGYRDQLDYYFQMNERAGKVTTLSGRLERETVPHFLFVDKQLGHIKAVPFNKYAEPHYVSSLITAEVKASVLDLAINTGRAPERLPDAEVAEGKSGNMKLDTTCSYCKHKHGCWPGLRTFLYGRGPLFLTRVVVEPKVPEIK